MSIYRNSDLLISGISWKPNSNFCISAECTIEIGMECGHLQWRFPLRGYPECNEGDIFVYILNKCICWVIGAVFFVVVVDRGLFGGGFCTYYSVQIFFWIFAFHSYSYVPFLKMA